MCYSSKSYLSYSAGSKKYNSAVIPESSKRELELSLVQYVSKMNAKRTLFKLKVCNLVFLSVNISRYTIYVYYLYPLKCNRALTNLI